VTPPLHSREDADAAPQEAQAARAGQAAHLGRQRSGVAHAAATGSLAAREPDNNLTWWNYPVPPEDEVWLFMEKATGLPVKTEVHIETNPLRRRPDGWNSQPPTSARVPALVTPHVTMFRLNTKVSFTRTWPTR
jgi:hypothetical protein